ncbi:MAG: siroheme decarboxylase subunit beta [Smithellaceae bacterium]
MKTLTIPEKKAAQILQHDLPLIDRPFAAVAEACGLSTIQLIDLLKKLSADGILRKFGAVLRHQKAGYRNNALVVWAVPPEAIENAGQLFASLSYISHCYERKPAFQKKYNLFTMLHAQDDDITSLVSNMRELINRNDYLILESLQEYKKTSPEYF